MALRKWLNHPLTEEVDLDDPKLIELRMKILRKKRFLTKIYADWYGMLIQYLPSGNLPVCELGSGPGFLQDLLPGVLTSDILRCKTVQVILDGQNLPFQKGALRAVVMVNVLHHIQSPKLFFTTASRSIIKGGRIIMIEPWKTSWAGWIYTHLHHEDFDPNTENWSLADGGPLSKANGALPWIIFQRDSADFMKEYPEWSVQTVQPFMPFLYLLSGGISTKMSFPTWSYDLFRRIEYVLKPLWSQLGMFALITLQRV